LLEINKGENPIRRFNPKISPNDWPLLNRVLDIFFNKTLPELDGDVVTINSDITAVGSDLKYLSDNLNIIDGGNSTQPT
jgi:hypothetical protein